MTGLGKIFVFLQFVVAVGLLALGFGLYSNHVDWEAKIKKENERIKELSVDRDRADARWLAATNRLLFDEDFRPKAQKRFEDKLALLDKGPAAGAQPQAFVTELDYDKATGYLNVTSGKRYMDAIVFTGAPDPAAAGSDAASCGGWVAGANATAGRASDIPSWFDSGLPEPCLSDRADIYCFQSD